MNKEEEAVIILQPTLLCEERSACSSGRRRYEILQPTLLCEERSVAADAWAWGDSLQPTLLCEERYDDPAQLQMPIIATHAPVRGAIRLVVILPPEEQIATHAPVRGAIGPAVLFI